MQKVTRSISMILVFICLMSGCSKTPVVDNNSGETNTEVESMDNEMTTISNDTTTNSATTETSTIGSSNATSTTKMTYLNKTNSYATSSEENTTINPVRDSYTQTWIMNEISLTSSKEYDKPFYDVDVEMILTNGKTTYKIPGFWDGDNNWKIRFVCPTEGDWKYKTVCTDTSNKGLHNKSKSFYVSKYNGKYDIYKKGFVKAEIASRHFKYNDGTPFFYLGDTHWSLSQEPLSNIKTIVDERVKQGFTVIQSEPIGATFDFTDGITQADIKGLQENDAKFKYIADNGLVHVNASFFFPASMSTFIANHGGYSDVSLGALKHEPTGTTKQMYDLSDTAKKHLELITRYWVARYSAFPVMWSLGQEVDKDFYWSRDDFGGHVDWSYVNNPYVLVAKYINKHDPYKQPLSAHQENASITKASDSAFRNVNGHNFYAAQWSPSITGNDNYTVPKEFWNNSNGKLTINYEGRYCYLWTKNFGARAQGWISYLNGMYGYGWGAHDTWSYQNPYNEDADSSDGIDTITSQEKINATWEDSLKYPSAFQVGYMRHFFEDIVGDWQNLIPRFGDKKYISLKKDVYAVIATKDDKSKAVVYFYNFSDTSVGENPNSPKAGTKTGTVKNLEPNTVYKYLWFNPIDGKIETVGKFETNTFGNWKIGEKRSNDMVLYIYK